MLKDTGQHIDKKWPKVNKLTNSATLEVSKEAQQKIASALSKEKAICRKQINIATMKAAKVAQEKIKEAREELNAAIAKENENE